MRISYPLLYFVFFANNISCFIGKKKEKEGEDLSNSEQECHRVEVGTDLMAKKAMA